MNVHTPSYVLINVCRYGATCVMQTWAWNTTADAGQTVELDARFAFHYRNCVRSALLACINDNCKRKAKPESLTQGL